MDYVTYPPKKIVGISVDTTNSDAQAQHDIMLLWQRFSAEDVLISVPDRVSDTVYAVYHYYQGDGNDLYTVTIGLAVSANGDASSYELEVLNIPAQTYAIFPVSGVLPDAVVATWEKICEMDKEKLDRSYGYDFEIYQPGALDPHDAKLDICIAVNT